jgi:hypothetical protein
MDIAVLDDHVAQIDTDPKLDPLILRDGNVALCHFAQDRNGTGHGLDHAGEFDQDAIASRLDDTTPVLGDFRVNEFAAVRSETRQCSGLVLAH